MLLSGLLLSKANTFIKTLLLFMRLIKTDFLSHKLNKSVSAMLQPGLTVKPVVSENEVREILQNVYGLKCLEIKALNGYDDSNFHVKVEKCTDNENLENINDAGYTLKIINSLDSEKPHLFEAQSQLLIHLNKSGICCPRPVQNKKGDYQIVKKFSSGEHVVRLLEFIEGPILHQVPCSEKLFYQCGKFVAEIDNALKMFHHPVYTAHTSVWQLESVPKLSQFLFAIKDDSKKRIVQDVINQFSTRVLPVSPQLDKGMIHGDFNEQNVVVQRENDEWVVKAILDFGDSHFTCYLYELAIAMAYMMIQGKSIDIGGCILAGYCSIRKIPVEEMILLKVCVAARLCQSLVLGAYTSLQDPQNSYILVTSKPGWVLLQELWTEPEEKLLERWRRKVV